MRGFIFLISSLWLGQTAAMSLPPVPTEPIYFEPPVVQAEAGVRVLTCYQLDMEINQLHPYRYSYKPPFYEDGTNKLATALVVFDSVPLVEGWLGLGYLGYSALVDEKEDRRQIHVEQQIASLQRVKAEKHCYE
ncbi:hypothetical protein [Methylophaga sp.]|uniref:hypothetical protein n=1 Tax=Methylophaga sp. TaxID=2024840 RepID=UPI001400BABE|nr:hypothetical protein [Methylophaga sp.]MTI64455.1 hypothetical protein [Methylophaga sp.]